MGRNDKRRANYNATRNRSFRYELKQWNYTKISLTLSNVCAPTRNILGEYSSHFKYSLLVNEKNILSDYHSFFEPRAWNFLHLDWINVYHNDLYQNDFVSKRPVTFLRSFLLLLRQSRWSFIPLHAQRRSCFSYKWELNCSLLLPWKVVLFLLRGLLPDSSL